MLSTQTCAAAEAPITVLITPGQSPSEVDAAIKAAAQGGRTVTVKLQETAVPPAPQASTPTAPMVSMGEMLMVNDLWAALQNGTQMSIAGLRGLPAAFSSSWETLSAEANGPSRTAGFTLLSILCAAALTFAADLAVKAVLRRHPPQNKFLLAILRLLADALGIAIFAAISHFVLHNTLAHGSFSREAAAAMVNTIAGILIYAAIGRFFLRPCMPGENPLLPIAHSGWHLFMLVLYGTLSLFTANSLRLADLRMIASDAADSWLFLTVSVLTIVKLYWFIAGRSDIAEAFAGKDAKGFRWAIGHFLADFYAISAILIWASGLLMAGTTQNVTWARAAALTQFLLIIIPIIDHGIFALFADIARKREETHGRSLQTVTLWSLRAPLAGAVWIAGLHLIVIQWQPMMMGAAALVTTWLIWLERISVALIASWTLCAFLIKYFETVAPATAIVLPGQEDDEAKKETSRLGTILPVVRNLILSAVIAIAALVVISSAGVDVAPLLAGFGVLGLAFSFGSQSLVKDIVSGIFFLAEDAFRIGEYIDTGKLMGTVEQITIRSVRLRHHNGPIHTIPFGQITSVTNYSRDWGTIKFELRFDRNADLELIRKTAKKVGLALLQEPEYGSEFLVPLKMQGIQAVTETSLVIRFKFTARPGNPSILKREGMKRLLAAFKAANIALANNAVTVNSPATPAEIAAASATVLPLPANQG
ncbi:mechanosensitive ion channel family protein [Rhizobium oryzicola]|uniref:Mechanosensitive ion channel family protein n=1 Tax=Rhizobium oryzicola TaxID=1232668 RepID=A0ABT8SYV5_9HYPH|nr:mechanosensitive ion channel family protein [Rhizobium oryzicola]MDO1583588.1 mechanosensitive ion channel family protein [Rhizobium oryzicola]